MKNICFYLVCAFWFLLCLKDWIWIPFFSLIFLFYFYLRFHKKWVLFLYLILSVWACILLNPKEVEAKPGQYTIVQIKTNYVIAKKDQCKIILYGLKNPNFFEVYKVKTIEKCSELKNINQFSFLDYLKKDHITYCASVSDQDIRQSSHSLKARIYSAIKSNELLCANLYGIQNENILMELGLPIISSYYVLYSILRRHFSQRPVQISLLILMMIYGYLFVYSISIVRFICFQCSKLMFKDRKDQMSFSLFVFLQLLPGHALDFSIVFPVLYRLCFYYVSDSNKRWILQKLLLIFSQFIYFHEVDFFLFFFFSPLRKVQFLALLASFFHLSIPFFTSWIGKWTYHYVPGLLFFFLLLLLIVKRKKIIIILLCLCPFFESHLDPFFHVYLINIGQGDCTLIVEPFHKSAVMIDCGQNLYRDNVKKIILPVLENLQIHQLTALICTHDDFDHSGGKEELMENIEIEQVITSRDEQVHVSYPFYSLLEKREAKDENDESIVSYFSYDDVSYLWMGDASIDIEKQLLASYQLDVDILKLGHHGSKTSSSYAFLDALRPKIGLISVGKKNRYGHPSTQVVANCHDLGIETLATKDLGMIHIFSFHSFVFFESATHLIGRIS